MSNMVVATNVLALNSHRNLKTVGSKQSQASARLSSGYKINSAADDAAGLAISEKMRAQIRGLDMASKNAQDGASLIQTAEGGMQEIDNMLQKIRELTNQAANDTNENNAEGTGDRQKIQDEINQLTQEIDKMAERVEFNKKKVINGSYADVDKQLADKTAELQRLKDAANVSGTAASELAASAKAALMESIADLSGCIDGKKGSIATHEGSIASTNACIAEIKACIAGIETESIADLQTCIDENLQVCIDNQNEAIKELKDEIAKGNLTETEVATFETSIANRTSIIAESTGCISDVKACIANYEVCIAGKNGKYAVSIDQHNSIISNTIKVCIAGNEKSIATLNDKIAKLQNKLDGKTNGSSDSTSAMLKIEAVQTQVKALEEMKKNQNSQSLYFQIGANADQGIDVNIGSVKTDLLGIGDGDGNSSINVVADSGHDITGYLDVLDNALSYVTTERSKLGATQNRLDYAMKSLDISSENLSAAESRIRDTDMAKEMMKLTQANILQQASTSMLAQANQAPQNVLQLLG